MRAYDKLPTLVSLEVALAAKKLGFSCTFLTDWYDIKMEKQYGRAAGFSHEPYDIDDDNHIGLPTQEFLCQYFRDVHQIHVFDGYRFNKKQWDSHAYSLNLTGKEYIEIRSLKEFQDQPVFYSRDTAINHGLLHAIKLLTPNIQNLS